mgnify:CR=1 FL=1
MTDRELYEIAVSMLPRAYAPFSKYQVGAALLTKEGKLYTGVNVENSSFGGTICAERTAFVKAVSEGDKEFEKIAIVGGKDKLVKTTPCGICRQFISMHCPNIQVIYLDNEENICKANINELLPQAFEEEF